MRRPVLPLNEEVRKDWIDWQAVAKKTAIVSGVFSLILGILLLVNHINLNRDDVLDSPELMALKAELREDSNNQDLKDIIRDRDAILRQQYFRRYHRQNLGGIVLTVALAVFFLSLRMFWINKPMPPEPGPDPHKADELRREKTLGRRAVWGLVLVMSASAALLYGTVNSAPPGYVDPDAALEPTGPVTPTWDDLAAQWPSFRGQGANSRVQFDNWRGTWSKDEGVRWHEKVALDGLNSPVIWNDKLFLSGAVKSQRYVYCLNVKNGKTIWRQQVKDVPYSPEEHPHVEESFTGYAAPTVACDGNNVYAIFANGDLVAFNFDGELQWSMNVGIEGNLYGYSASLAIHEHLLFVQVDQDEGAYVMALDALTRELVWEHERNYGGSWASPALAKVGGEVQLVVVAAHVIGYDPFTGAVKWDHELMSGDIAPTPIFANDVMYVVNMACPLTAIKPNGEILWKNEDGAWPDTTSPVTDGKHIWLVDSSGITTCVDCQSGKIVWEEKLEGAFTASPTIVNDEVIILDEEGKAYVLAVGDAYNLKRSFDTGIPMKTTPSFDKKGNMYIRSGKDVFCIGGL